MYPPCKQLYKIHTGCGKETVYYVSIPASNYMKSIQGVERRQYIMYPPCKQLYKIHTGCGKETVCYVSTPASNYIKSMQGVERRQYIMYPPLQATISNPCRVLKGDSILCIHPCKQLYKIRAGCGKETVYYVSIPASNYIKSIQGVETGKETVYYVSTLQATI